MVEKSITWTNELVTWAARSECAIWRLRARNVVTIEMPMDEPIERARLSTLDPSVRRAGGRVAKALAFIGMKISPMPRPWTKPDVAMCR